MASPGIAFPPFAKAAVESRFKKLLEGARFTEADQAAYQGHVSSVATRLRGRFEVAEVKVFGSVSRGTAVRQRSDVDLLVVLQPSEFLWGGAVVSSTTILSRLRDELNGRFPNTALGRDGEAVVVPFRDGIYPIDVVPAFVAVGSDEGNKTYGIPSFGGNWQSTSPDAHRGFILKANLKAGGRLSEVARLAKIWRTSRYPEVRISSFHLELLLAGEGSLNRECSLAEGFYLALKTLNARECRALRDPLGIAGFVSVAQTDAQRGLAQRIVSYSLVHAEAGLRAAYSGHKDEAIRQWDLVFNGCFPKS